MCVCGSVNWRIGNGNGNGNGKDLKWVGSRHPIQMSLNWKWPSSEVVFFTNGSDQCKN